jgi:hypothetical protein
VGKPTGGQHTDDTLLLKRRVIAACLSVLAGTCRTRAARSRGNCSANQQKEEGTVRRRETQMVSFNFLLCLSSCSTTLAICCFTQLGLKWLLGD